MCSKYPIKCLVFSSNCLSAVDISLDLLVLWLPQHNVLQHVSKIIPRPLVYSFFTPSALAEGVIFKKKQMVFLLIHMLLYLLNFFFLDRDPKKCAKYHGDKHLNKMQLEYTQIVSTAWWIIATRNNLLDSPVFYKVREIIYKPTHTKHPVVLWAAKSQAHMMAIINVGLALAEEKKTRSIVAKRHGKKWSTEHKSTPILEFIRDNLPSIHLFELGDAWIDPPACMPKCVQDSSLDVVECYRLFYSAHKVEITGLQWLPYVEEPDFLVNCRKRISLMPEVVADIANEQHAPKKRKVKK